MGKPSITNPPPSFYRRALSALTGFFVFCGLLPGQATRATTVPLLLPAGIAFDSTGTLYLTEIGGQQVLAVSPAGILTVYAGSGIQGFAGDGGPATAARLDSPSAVAVSPAGDLYVADTHNHRIRRISASAGIITTIAGTGQPGVSPDGTSATAAPIDLPVALAFDPAGTLYFVDARSHLVRRIMAGVVTTVAGNGLQGFSGDGGPATAAALDTPSGIAVDGSGAIFLADSHNQRIRRVDPVSHSISTVAGNGAGGFAGDGGIASAASLRLPRGLVVDSAGNLFLTDSSNDRIRRVDGATGIITTVAGSPVQRFAGDGGPAVAAATDTPRALSLGPAGLLTLSDSANGRVRQIDAAAVIHTIAGLGETDGTQLTLTAPSTIPYGTGSVTATLAASPASGSITLLDTASGQPVTLASVSLTANTASFSTAGLSAGVHLLSATYAGDNLHSSAQSQLFTLTVVPAGLLASPDSLSILYGQPIPVPTATLTGLLPADAASVMLQLGSAATAQSPPALYPITGTLSGAAAANYSLTVAPAFITITKAPAVVTLASSGSYSAHVTSTTSGTPTGTVTLLDGGQAAGSTVLVAGFAVFSPTLAAGSHSLSAVYAGDIDFLAAVSAVSVVTVDPGPIPDFTLQTSGVSSQTIAAGSAASFAFSLGMTNGGPPSAIQLAVTGLPQGATASFNPPYIPPGGAVTSTILTIQTPHAALLPFRRNPLTPVWAMLLPLLVWTRRKKGLRRCLILALSLTGLGSMIACGDRVSTSGQTAPAKTYPVTVTGTATGASGAVLQHSVTVLLSVQ